MPNKGERILITKVSANCRAQRIACDPFDDEEGLFCDKNGQYVRITEKDCAKCKHPVFAGIPAQRPWREWDMRCASKSTEYPIALIVRMLPWECVICAYITCGQ